MVSRKRKAGTKGTRKVKSKRAPSTVEGIHSSFAVLDKEVTALINKGRTDSELVACIKNTWNNQFHTAISGPALKGMVMHYRKVHPSKRVSRKSKQVGGMAPLSYMMGPGITNNEYGRFPVEIGTSENTVRGLDLGRFYENNGGRSCDTTGGHAAPGQLGGGIWDALSMPQMPASVPRNFLETGVSSIQGAPIMNPHASPVSAQAPSESVFAPRPHDVTGISAISSMAPIYKPL